MKNHLPLSSNQRRLWFMAQQDKNNPAYNLPHTYHIEGEVDYDVFSKSLEILFNRQYTMFSVFRHHEDGPYIDIVSQKVAVQYVDFSYLPSNIRKEKIFLFAGEATRECFDIENGPLYRLYLLKEEERSFYFHSVKHHIIFDGMSMRIFLQELSSIYSDLINGKSESFIAPAFQSYDFAEIGQEPMSNEEESALVKFWKEYLHECPNELKFPYDYSRKKALSGLGYRESIIIPESLTLKLKKLANETKSSIFKTVFSIIGVLMAKYTGEEDICLGFPVSSRHGQTSLEEVFGFFVSTAVARLKVDGDLNFKQYLSSSKDTVNKAIVNSKLPFDRIIEAVNPERIPFLNPLFQVSLSWLNNVFPWDLNGSPCRRINVPYSIAPFDISFYLYEEENNIKGEIEYSVDLFKHETILRLKNNLLTLIENLTERPDESIKKISLISESEIKMINDINNTTTEYPKDKTIIQLFEEQATLFADKTALVYKKESLTYKQLNERVNQLAWNLRALGVRPDSPVGVFADKSSEMIIGVLAILKSGGAYLPIDPEYPLQRVEFIIKEAECKILLTQSKYMKLAIKGVKKVNLNSPGSYKNDTSNLKHINSSSDLAYIMYTSGTTGVPKGSMIRQYSVIRTVRNVNYMEMSSDDRILYTSAIVFDVTTYEIWGALLNGMSLYVVDKETILDAEALGEELTRNNITILHLTSALFTQLAEARTDIFAGLKYLLVGGDVLSPSHINKVRKDNPLLKVINCYGPSENTTYSTTYLIEKTHDSNIPIGKPISNSTVYIFDKYLNYQPVGIMGEIYVGGDGLSKGYLKREDLNNTSFIENRYIPGDRLYKTGDYGKWLSDGNIEFHGRADNQIKIRGFRVELEEIESVISQIDGIIETVIKPIKLQEGDFRLFAFLNVNEDFSLDSKAISSKIKEKLPIYMVPSGFKLMHGFPKTVNGKTDKQALTVNISDLESENRQDRSGLTPTENKIHKIWSEALKTEDLSVNDKFFEVGGNSLLSVRIINQIREVFSISLTFGDFVLHSTIALLAELIDSQKTKDDKSIQLVHLNDTEHLPLTKNQKRLWIMTQLQPDIPSYIIRLTYKLKGSLNTEVFEQSINRLFQRHHIVFSVIKEIKGEPFCEIKPVEVKISHLDFTYLPIEEKHDNIIRVVTEDSKQPFNLEKGPLFRIHLIHTADDEYYFHMSIHHIVFDGWSQGIFINDLSKIYNSILAGNETGFLGDLEFQQYDYARLEEGFEENKESLAFWRENMSGCSPVLNFPYDYSRRETYTGRGMVESIRLSKYLSEELRRISKKENTSLFNTMTACFGIMMHKYSGDDDINVGLPVTYRPHTKLENIFGMFVNTVVVRLKYRQESSFRELIKESGKATLNAIAHQDLPFDRIVGLVNPERTSNINPLFQVAFAWQNNLNQTFKMDGVKSERVKIRERAPIFDLILYQWEKGEFIDGEIEYNTDLLKHDTILRFKDHFQAYVRILLENPDTPVNVLPMISDTELKMIAEVNDTFTEYSQEKRIIDLFEESALKFPERKAIAIDNQEITYAELNTKANQLAVALQSQNVGRGDFVGILLKRSPDLVACLLALYKVGAAYVPLNLTDPDSRIKSIMEAAQIKYIITNADNNINVGEKYVRLIIEDLTKQAESIATANVKVHGESTDPAYIIFTSGTTGTPKGVLVNHKAVINLIEWVNKTFRISVSDKLIWVTNLSFDLSVYDIFGILAAGACIRILNDEDRLNPQKQFEILLKEGITFWDSAPQSLQQLVPFFNSSSTRMQYDSLRIVFLSGDWIPLSLQPDITAVFRNAIVIGLGGATEATVWSNYFIINDMDPEWSSIPYGKPLQNCRYYILDEYLNHCRVRQPGNLYIGGDCLALGYFNDPKLTATKFIPDPFNPGSKLYFTGDRAQWMADGNIEFLGRDDEQIKIRGYRVELGEIKDAVLQNKIVKEALIIPDKTDRHNIKVILFYTTKDDIQIEARDIKNGLRRSLPEYMIPADVVHCKEFPLSPNGKVDTKILMRDYQKSIKENQTVQVKEIAPVNLESLTSTQKKIYRIWGEVLDNSLISVTDNFFDAGGNSLLGIRIMNQIREDFGISLTFRELVTNATVLQLGDFIDYKISNDPKDSIVLYHVNETRHLPLTSNQKRLWILSKLEPELPTYVIRLTYKLTGSLDHNIFKEAINVLFNRHHIVFSVIKEEDGEPYCDIEPSEVKIRFIDRTDVAEPQRYDSVMNIITDDARKLFNLEEGPLFRLYLIQTDKNEHYFHMSIHHIIFDGWSQNPFVNDLSKIYNGLLTGEAVNLEKLECQLYDYARWESVQTDRPESISFWKQNLDGCSPILNFPYDFSRGEKNSWRGGVEKIKLTGELSNNLRQISKATGTSLFTTLMSCVELLMHRYSGEDDINIGMPVTYRPHSKLENIFGMFVNTLVVRSKYESQLNFREWVVKTDNAAMNAISHQDIPFETVVEIVKPERISNANPLFQVAFAWQNNLFVPLKLKGIQSYAIKREERGSIFDITFVIWENGEEIEGEIEYNFDLFRPDTISRLKDHFLILINNLILNSEQPVRYISMISEQENKMITEINKTATEYPRDKTIVQLFEEITSKFPDELASCFKKQAITYRHLNERANILGRTLRTAGVNVNTPVGLYADKSLEMIVGVLGILKAGGCYVPIDPDYPAQRVNFIIKDAGIDILLVQEKYMTTEVEGVTKLCINSDDAYNQDNSNMSLINSPEDNAYILYTSGTTGTPKGTSIQNRGVVRLVRNTNYIVVNPGDKILMAGTIVFDASTMEIWSALLNGASLHLIDKETLLDPDELGKELLDNDIKFLILTPALFTHLSETRTDIFRKLRYLIVGGDVLPAANANKVRKSNPELILINGYGPTENTTLSTFFVVDRDFETNIPIGKPNSNSTAYVMDKDLNYQPFGLTGELYVGGDGLSKGYLNREDLNNKCFVTNPHNPGERLYKTGDLARWLPDGNLEFKGRIDNQLKIRGFRVELEEIESVLSEIDGVVEAVVKPLKVEHGDYRLVAFINVPESFTLGSEEIILRLRAKLPAFMIPSSFQFMNGFPKTINGKTDRKKLSVDEMEIEKSAKEETVTISPSERELYSIWGKVLKTDDLSVSTNFFDVGGTSLSGLRVVNLIHEKLGVAITFKELLANQTIRQLASFIDSNTGATGKSVSLIHLTDHSNLPLTNNQKRLWIINKLQPDVPSYIVPTTYRLTGTLDREQFELSINLLFQRHHVVFSVFKERDGEPYCEIVQQTVKISYIDYSPFNEEEKRKKLSDLVNSDKKRTFDFEQGPLYRLYLIKTSESEHYFHMSIHHIIFDGWSQGILNHDLSSIYNGLISGKVSGLEELEFQQYDYALWESNSEESKESVAFWKDNLKDCSPVLNFPYDFPRVSGSTGRAGFEQVTFTRTISKALKQISKEEDASLFTVLLSAFGVLLNKYSGDDDINIGLPVAYRPHTKLENIFGMFVNTIVVRLKFDRYITFRDSIRLVNEEAMNSLAHQDLPFDRVVEIVKPDRTTNINPLFQVDFSWQANLEVPMNLEGIKCEKVKMKERNSIFDLSLSLWENGDFIEGEIDYNMDLIRPETAARLKSNFLNLVNSLIENIDLPINSVSILSDEERRMIGIINETHTDYPRDKTIIQIFEEVADLYPDRTAVVFKSDSLTYKQLNEKTNQFARILRESGVNANTPVGIMIDKSVNMIVGIYGILKAGGAYVPIDPDYPKQRKDFIVKDSGCKILVTQDSYKNESLEGVKIISLDDTLSYHIDTSNVNCVNIPTDLAYIIYTSGTTGLPKGTLIPHRGMVRLVCTTNYVQFKPEDRILQTHSIVFDSSVVEIFGALLHGSAMYVVDKETLLDADLLKKVLWENKITILDLAAALFAQIAETRTDVFGNLKHLMLGGDIISAPRVNKLRKDYPQVMVSNCYGPTENSCNSVAFKIDRDFEYNIPIGRPISNSTAYIFDKNMNYQAVGIIGELYVGGDGLSLGYLNRDDLNSKSFIDNPHNPGERLYKTGDLARWLPDWNIEFRGRADNQLKIRGFRVELGEIEAVLSDIDGVIESVVKPVRVGEGDYRLVAFLNVPESFRQDTNEIIRQIKTKLPTYMVPSVFRYMNGFPMNSSGKIDRKALIVETEDFEKREKTDPSKLSPTEREMHILWCEALKTDDVAVNEDFFDVGGNSLLAIRLLNKLREKFHTALTFSELVANSTIEQLSILIDRQKSSSMEAIDLEHLTDTTNLPLTANQKRLWIISKLQPDVPSYIMTLTYKFRGSFNREIFETSLDILLKRHHIVFSVFKNEGGEPFCEISLSNVNVKYIDYTIIPDRERETKVRETISAELKKPFKLDLGPLYRLYLFKTNEDEFFFHMSIHHIVFDGWSQDIFVKDLCHIYNNLVSGKEPDLEVLEFQQYDFARWEAKVNENQRSADFWEENLRDCSSILNFPYDFPRKEKYSGRGDLETIKLPQDLSERLRHISREANSSLFTLMMSAYGLLMHKYSGDDDLNIGLPVAYRPHSKLEQIFGMFVNTIVIRLKYERDYTFRDLIRVTNDTTMNAISHQNIPFERIVEIVSPERASNTNPLFQVAFVWQNNLGAPMLLHGVDSEPVKIKQNASVFDITLSLWENGDIIEGAINYNVDILTRTTINRLKENYVNLLRGVVENIDKPIGKISIITREEKERIDALNETSTDYPRENSISQLFEEEVRQNPDHIAISFKGESYTYKELNEKANQLARRLRKAGVIVNTPVGLFLEKSLEMIVGILGILKAGGCYVPIDTEYPEERILFIIKDAEVKLLLTQDKFMDIVPEGGVQKINLNSEGNYDKDNSDLDSSGTAEDFAYILFTSGTTGIPKGSLIPQRGVVRLVRNTNYLNITSDDRILLAGAIVFDATTLEIWGALLNGGALYIINKEILLDLDALQDEISSNEITTLIITSALFTHLAELRPDIFKKLKQLVVGGDVLSISHVNKIQMENPNLIFINAYGPTENSCTSTAYRIEREQETAIPIGKPVSNSSAYIFDKNLNYQPIGVVGELCVGGDGLSAGYLNREELNKKSFFEHPDKPGVRLYRTGDLARWLPDLNIEFRGRMDNQIKIRGFRVELEEIESVLGSIEGVNEAVVKPVKVAEGDYRLVAFLNVSDTFKMEAEHILRKIKTKLPSYMVPSTFRYMHGFPLTVNGKIDKKALNASPDELEKREKIDIEKLSGTERTILKIWCDALKTDDIALEDNFFDIGGNSLMAVSVLSKIEETFSVDLGLRVFFDSPKIKDIAETVDLKQKTWEKNNNIKTDDNVKIVNGEI